MLPILHQSLWRDEALSFFLAEKPLNEIFLLVTKDIQAPLYYFILHYWMVLFGNSEAVIRTLSVFFHISLGILILLFGYKLTKSISVGLLSALLTIFNPFLLVYSFEARPYTLLAFLITLALYFFFIRKFIFASLVLSLAIFTHNFALLSFLGLGIYWAWSRWKEFIYGDKRVFLEDSLKLFLIPVVSTLFWAGFVWKQWAKVAEAFWIQPPTSGVFLQLFHKFFGGVVSFEGQDFLITLAYILLVFTISAWIVNKKTEFFKVNAVFPFVSLIPIISAYLISIVWVPILHERYLIASAPLLVLFVGVSVYNLTTIEKRLAITVISLAIVYSISSLQAAEKIIYTTSKPSINYAVNQVLAKAQNGDIIIPKEYINFLEIKYYLKRAGSSVPVYALSLSGEIIWYANTIVIDKSEIIKELPKNTRVWQINPDGGYELK